MKNLRNISFIIPNLDLVNTNAHAIFGHKILSGKENQTSINGHYSVRKVQKTISNKQNLVKFYQLVLKQNFSLSAQELSRSM